MKKLILAIFVVYMLGGCFIFRKKEKYGCPNDNRGLTQDEILAKDKKKKYKGGSKY